MKVQIDKTYPMPCSVDIAWDFLQNIEAVAGCMPGAKITEHLDASHYKLVKDAYAKDPRGMQRPEYDRALERLLAHERELETTPVAAPPDGGIWDYRYDCDISNREDMS